MKKRYLVKWRNLDGEKVIMATNDKAKAYSYGRRNLPRNKELIIEDTEAGTKYRALRA